MIITVDEARRRGILGRPKKAKRPEPPVSYTPHRALILGIDSAKRSGWGLLECRGGLGAQPEVVTCDESVLDAVWAHVVAQARSVEELRLGMPLVVVMETWTTGGRADRRMGPSTLLGLGESRGRWRTLLKNAGHPKRRMVSVNTATWRAGVLGPPMSRSSAEWKSAAQQYVRGRFGIDVGPDAAEGLCIAVWGAYAGRVGALLPKRR